MILLWSTEDEICLIVDKAFPGDYRFERKGEGEVTKDDDMESKKSMLQTFKNVDYIPIVTDAVGCIGA